MRWLPGCSGTPVQIGRASCRERCKALDANILVPSQLKKHLNNSLSQHHQRERAYEGVALVYNEDIDINNNRSLTKA